MDSTEMKTASPAEEVFEAEGKPVTTTHGLDSPWGIEGRVMQIPGLDPIDVVAYCHYHRSQSKAIDGILFFDPSAATDSFGILTIGGAKESNRFSAMASYRLITMEA
jgi:predicted phosphodiesterase